jgi:hypothetical protein
MGTLKGLAAHSAPATHPATPSLRSASPFPRPLPATHHPARCARPRALWRSREGRVRRTRGEGRGGGGPEVPTESVGKARLRLRDAGNPRSVPRRGPKPCALASGLATAAAAAKSWAKPTFGHAIKEVVMQGDESFSALSSPSALAVFQSLTGTARMAALPSFS